MCTNVVHFHAAHPSRVCSSEGARDTHHASRPFYSHIRPCIRIVLTPGGSTAQVAWSGDKALVLRSPSPIHLREARSGARLRTLSRHLRGIKTASDSPSNETAAACLLRHLTDERRHVVEPSHLQRSRMRSCHRGLQSPSDRLERTRPPAWPANRSPPRQRPSDP